MDKMAVTGGAGFIGSNLAEHLLSQGHEVLLIDNFSTGRESNLKLWAERAGDRVKLLRADVNETEKLRHAFRGVLYVFHQAAIPSVPRSIEDPKGTESSNINGSLSLLLAARDAGVRRVVLASSSSVYGDDHNLPKVEERVGRPLSPYALSKSVGEQYCRLFYELYGLETVCLRYFNVFGPRQDPKSVDVRLSLAVLDLKKRTLRPSPSVRKPMRSPFFAAAFHNITFEIGSGIARS